MIYTLVCLSFLHVTHATTNMQKIELVRDANVSVELVLKRSTDLSQLQWYWLEITNLTKKPFRIHFQFRMEGTLLPNQTMMRINTQLNDLLGDSWSSKRDFSLETLKPGMSTYGLNRFSRETSVSALPAFPKEPIKLQLSPELNFAYWINNIRTDLQSPNEAGCVVLWTKPTEAGIVRLKQELSGYFHQTDPMNQNVSQRYAHLLRLSDLSDGSMTIDRIMERLEQTDNPHDPLVRHVVLHYRNDPKVIDFYRKKLITCSKHAYYALAISPDNFSHKPGIWDPSYCSLLADCFVKDKPQTNMIYGLLDRHKKEWRNDNKVTSLLFEEVRKSYPVLDIKNWEGLKQQTSGLGEDEMDQLAFGLIWLGRTCDKRALAYLEKGLQMRIELRVMPQAFGITLPYKVRGNSIAECAAMGIMIWVSDEVSPMAISNRANSPDELIKKAKDLLTIAKKTANSGK